MAIPVTNTQGTKAYLIASGTDITTVTKIETALGTAKTINCIQNIGDIGSSRNVQSYSCMSSDEVAKSLGSLSIGNISMDLLFDAANTAGQADLLSAYNTNTRRIMIVQLNDEPTTGTNPHPTYISFEIAVSSLNVGIEKDNAVMFKSVIEICQKPIIDLASGTTV